MSTPGSQNTDTEETNCTFCSSSSSSASSGQSNGECEQCEQCEGSSRSADADCNTKGGLNDGVPSPIFSSDWQDSQTFFAEGGFLRQTGSDVILHVPPGAVERNTQIKVHSSICADVDHIRHLMNLSENEEVVSPLVEYWAGEDFEFQRPVTITLRHCLPADFDADMVQIYHLTRGHGSDLDLAISKIKKAVDLSEDGRLTMAASADVHENAQGNFSMEWTQQDLEGGGFYLFDSDTAGNVQIKTNRFCGYVCTFCHAKKKKNVELYAAGSGSSSDESRPVINVSVHVWDAKLKVADFRKLYEIEADTREPVHLLEDLKDSLLYVRLRIIEETADAVRHCEDEHGQLVKPLQKGFDLPKILSCRKCLHKGKIKPISYKWLLKQYDTVQNNMSCFRFAIDLSHVAPETLKPSWTDTTSQARKERVTTTDLMVTILCFVMYV
ncbi:hypothetical protein V1264_007159 [Littorina saxatilis]|uniref:ZU5 domain-containing protein n=1 Tax=Littorina saxatilis TaxID=31220 RepID=A0AAN9AUV5_9CAEN